MIHCFNGWKPPFAVSEAHARLKTAAMDGQVGDGALLLCVEGENVWAMSVGDAGAVKLMGALAVMERTMASGNYDDE